MTDWTIDPDALRHVCPNLDAAQAERIADGLGEAFVRFEINTPRRAAMAVAQWAHESDHFRTATEYASGDAYEGRRDLGNTRPGDGRRFKGRGRIQVTGRANYERVAQGLGLDCVNRPDLLAVSPYTELASGFWWSANGCNALCDRDDFLALTRRINGGTNGLEDRKRLYARALTVAPRLVPVDRWAVLDRDERERMETLARARRVARRGGGWRHVDPSHLARAKEAKRWLLQRLSDMEAKATTQPDGWRRFRRRRRFALMRRAMRD
jgi:putative chitinase